MMIAQQLYEGIRIGSGHVGLITYMRTDSTRLSAVALNAVRDYIGENSAAISCRKSRISTAPAKMPRMPMKPSVPLT